MQKLQEWNWVRQLARRRVLASGLAAALFDEASKTTQVARVTAKFKKKMAAKSSAQKSPSQNSLAPPSVAEGAGASAEEGAGVSSPISPEAAHPASQHDDNHMEMHRIISRARSTNGSSTSALNADKALLQSAQPSAAKTTTLGPMALRALRRIESAISAFNVNDEMRQALVSMGVSKPRREPETSSGAKVGTPGLMLSEELKFALSPWRTGKSLALPVRTIIRLSLPVQSAIERFRRAVKATTLLLRISRSPQVMMAIKDILQGDLVDSSAVVVQRLFRRRRQEALEQGRIFGKVPSSAAGNR